MTPEITERINCPHTERRLISLPPGFRGLGILQKEYAFSTILSKDLTTNIINQQPQFATNNDAKKNKSKTKLTKVQHHNEELQKLRSTLSDEQKRLNELNKGQGASIWFTTIPLSEESYDLAKQLLSDLILIRHGWILRGLPSSCKIGNKFDIQHHALSCKSWGFVSLRHNFIRNITSILLKEVCKNVHIEPQLR